MKIVSYILLFISLIFTASSARAGFDSGSASFNMRQDVGSFSGTGSSTSFNLLQADGGPANDYSTSTSFKWLASFVKTLFHWMPQYTIEHYHWRNDDGSETTASSATGGSQDIILSPLQKQTPIRLRFEVSNNGGTGIGYSTQQFRVEYGLLSTTCSAIGTWTDVGAVGGDWDMYDSTNLTDGTNTTNIAIGSGGVSDGNINFITSNGGVKDTSSQTAAVSVSDSSFIELEYSMQALSAATDNGTYCFRLTNAGSTSHFSYSIYPQVLVVPPPSISYSISSNSINLGTLTPVAVSSANHTVTVTTNAASGYVLYVYEDGDLRNGANTITPVADGSVTAGSREYGLNTGFNDFVSDAAITTSNKIARQTNSAVTNEVTTCTYKASIDSSTVGGNYSHIVTYIVVGRF